MARITGPWEHLGHLSKLLWLNEWRKELSNVAVQHWISYASFPNFTSPRGRPISLFSLPRKLWPAKLPNSAQLPAGSISRQFFPRAHLCVSQNEVTFSGRPQIISALQQQKNMDFFPSFQTRNEGKLCNWRVLGRECDLSQGPF